FLISPDKIIAHSWANVKTKGHAQAVLKKLQELTTK
ncbi:MAG: peroxiredoxin, partial [Sphaerospermopsis kisseleviana]